MRKQLAKKIIDVLENQDFHILSNVRQNDDMIAELEYYSDEGEDVIVDIWHKGTIKSFADAFREYAEDFDPDEHAEMWVNYRGQGGCPSSIRALIDDADSIKEHLQQTALRLSQVAYG